MAMLRENQQCIEVVTAEDSCQGLLSLRTFLILDIFSLLSTLLVGLPLLSLALLGLARQPLPAQPSPTAASLPFAGSHSLCTQVSVKHQDTLLIDEVEGVLVDVLGCKLGGRLGFLPILSVASIKSSFQTLQVSLPELLQTCSFQLFKSRRAFAVQLAQCLHLALCEGPHLHAKHIFEAVAACFLLGASLHGALSCDLAHVLQAQLPHLGTKLLCLSLFNVQPVSDNKLYEAKFVAEDGEILLHLRHHVRLPLFILIQANGHESCNDILRRLVLLDLALRIEEPHV
mmetsp:Transcript_87400/g.155012  ORF Transcript_87400/g.155012 Transcript_87400/m.155012 type:complete len:286 (+) Transcript_87400:1911-2768(+)